MSEASMSYKEAALAIGCDHHYVRILVGRGTIRVHHTEEVRPHVLKVFVDSYDVYNFIETHKARQTVKVRVTPGELKAIRDLGITVKE